MNQLHAVVSRELENLRNSRLAIVPRQGVAIVQVLIGFDLETVLKPWLDSILERMSLYRWGRTSNPRAGFLDTRRIHTAVYWRAPPEERMVGEGAYEVKFAVGQTHTTRVRSQRIRVAERRPAHLPVPAGTFGVGHNRLPAALPDFVRYQLWVLVEDHVRDLFTSEDPEVQAATSGGVLVVFESQGLTSKPHAVGRRLERKLAEVCGSLRQNVTYETVEFPTARGKRIPREMTTFTLVGGET